MIGLRIDKVGSKVVTWAYYGYVGRSTFHCNSETGEVMAAETFPIRGELPQDTLLAIQKIAYRNWKSRRKD